MSINDQQEFGKDREFRVPDHNVAANNAVESIYDIGACAISTVTAVEKGNGVVHKTVLALASVPVSVVGAAGIGFGGVKIYTFTEGRILVHGCVCNVTFDTSGCDLDGADGGDFGIGTVIVADANMTDATDIDLCAAMAPDPISDGAQGQLAAAAQFDGTTAAITVNFQANIDDLDIAATEELLVNGTITITWTNLGDYTAP